MNEIRIDKTEITLNETDLRSMLRQIENLKEKHIFHPNLEKSTGVTSKEMAERESFLRGEVIFQPAVGSVEYRVLMEVTPNTQESSGLQPANEPETN